MFRKMIAGRYRKDRCRYRAKIYEQEKDSSAVQDAFEELCRNCGIVIERKVRFTDSMYIYRLFLSRKEKYRQLKKFRGLYDIEPAVPACMDEG